MTSVSSPSGGVLSRVVKRLARWMRLLACVHGAGSGLFIALLILIGAAWLDLTVELPSNVRFCLLGVTALAFFGVLLFAGARIWSLARPPIIARAVDSAAKTGGEVLTGVDLAESGPDARELSDGLRVLAVCRAGEVAAGVGAKSVLPLRGAVRPLLFFAGLLLVAACVAVLAPKLSTIQFVRILTPWVDQPPYSPYEFDVTPGDTKAMYGDTVNVSVRFGQAKPEQLEMLVRTETGAAEVLPMFPQADGAWRGQLRELTVPVSYTVRAAKGRTRAYRVDIIYTPQIARVTFKVTPPAYTGLPASEGPPSEKGIAGLAGTQVECTAESNRPLSGGDLALEWRDIPAETIKMEPTGEGSKSVKGSFVIKGNGRLSLGVVDTKALPCRSRVSCAITRLEDSRPFVRIAEPVATSYATPRAVLPLVVEADDDFGLTQAWLYRSLNESRDLPLPLLAEGEKAASVRAQIQLPLSAYKLAPGDVLTFYARAQDNDPDSPKGAESELVRVTIISQEEFDRLTQAKATLQDLLSKYQSQARALEALRERLKEDLAALKSLDPKSKDAADALSKELADMVQALAKQARQARDLASKSPLFDVDKSLANSLNELADALAKASQKTSQAGKSMPDSSALAALEEAAGLLGEGAEQYAANALQPLETLEKAYPLMEDAARFVQLYLRQKDLARRMASLPGSKDQLSVEDKVRMGDLAAEQDDIKAALGRLLDEMIEHELTLPDDDQYGKLKETAHNFVDAVSESGADNEIEAAGASLAEFDGPKAAEHAANAEKILAEFIAMCEGASGIPMQAQGALVFQPTLAKSLGNTIGQLLGASGLALGDGQALGGQGTGAQGGYSMQASTLDNVGLYGSSESESPDSQTGTTDRYVPTINVSLSSRDQRSSGGLTTGQEESSAAATLLQSVPPEYHKRVQEYFRRVAEESSNRPSRRR